MKKNNKKKLYDFYSDINFNPSFRNLNSKKKFSIYKQNRLDILGTKLGLTSLDFKNKSILEFGPNMGENSICFADWGGYLSLVEPNIKNHKQIKAYFGQFNLMSQL